ncbi:hypothetical protein BDR03DRAFT_1014723 [Suillus americanus]|nr:hypothetical protein BDR03DRAFT_1014723 [Suillus americanus]
MDSKAEDEMDDEFQFGGDGFMQVLMNDWFLPIIAICKYNDIYQKRNKNTLIPTMPPFDDDPIYDEDAPLDDDTNDGWGISAFNDGKGLRFNIEFIPLGSESDVSKRCKNANRKASTSDMLVKVLEVLKRRDLLEHSGLYSNGQVLDIDSLTITYSVPKTCTKDIALEGEDDFTEMVGQVQAKKNAEGTLVLIENKIIIPDAAQDTDDSDDETVGSPTHTQKKRTNVPDSDDDDTRQPNRRKKAKKQSQTREPNAEEEEQDRIIKDLQDRYCCKDKACPYNTCWPAGTSVNDHVHLTFQHLRLWASAIVSLKQAKLEDGIDIDHPPNSKMFDPSRCQTTSTAGSSDDSNDVLALAKQ